MLLFACNTAPSRECFCSSYGFERKGQVSNTASAVLRVLTALYGGYLCEGLDREVYGVPWGVEDRVGEALEIQLRARTEKTNTK